MSFITCYDDDPNDGLPGYRTYAVVNVTGPSATHYLSDGGSWIQKHHPISQMRAVSPPDVSDTCTAQCKTSGCPNVASGYGHKFCTKCRAKRKTPLPLTKCACGRPMYVDSTRCRHCFTVGRRMSRMAGWA